MSSAENFQNPPSNTLEQRLTDINNIFVATRVPTLQELGDAAIALKAVEGETIDPELVESVRLKSDPNLWIMSAEEFDTAEDIRHATKRSDLSLDQNRDFKNFKETLPQEEQTNAFERYKKYAEDRINLSDALYDLGEVDATKAKNTAELAIMQTPKQDLLEDVVKIDKKGHGHRQDGKFLSNHELSLIDAHKEQIVAGLADRHKLHDNPAEFKAAFGITPEAADGMSDAELKAHLVALAHDGTTQSEEEIDKLAGKKLQAEQKAPVDTATAEAEPVRPDGVDEEFWNTLSDSEKKWYVKGDATDAEKAASQPTPDVPATPDVRKYYWVDSKKDVDSSQPTGLSNKGFRNRVSNLAHWVNVKARTSFAKDNENYKRNRWVAAGLGVLGVAAAVTIVAVTKNHDIQLPNASAADPNATPEGLANTVSTPGAHTQAVDIANSVAVSPEALPSVANVQPVTLTLGHKGDNIWRVTSEYLQANGYPNDNGTLKMVKDAILSSNGITEPGAHHMSVGAQFTVPAEVLAKLHKS